MSWAGIVSNQCISCNNLQDAVNTGVFTLKNSIPVSTKQITKTESAYYVNLNTSYAPFAAKASNQLVVKSNLQACVPVSYSYTIYYYLSGDITIGYSTTGAACAATITAITVYSTSSSITTGTALYTDACCNNQFIASGYTTTTPYFKYLSSYITFQNLVEVSYGYIVQSVTSCGAASVTIDWTVENQSGGRLNILNNIGASLLDITSTAGSIQTGTLTVIPSNLPYTIRGTWISGGAVAYRVCDISGSELYYSGSITSGSNDYTPSPTPNYASVNLAAQGVTPPTCAVFV